MKFVILLILIIGCKANNKQLAIQGFDSKLWIKDSLGCNGERQKLAALLKDNFTASILHAQKTDLVHFLGRPNIIHQHFGYTIYTYFISKDRQCFDTLWRAKNFSDAPQILFHVNKNDSVEGMTGPIVP